MTAILQVKDLSVRFGGLAAITDMSMEVREGEVLSLIGPNGAGKTTAFNAITGYLAPTSGEIAFQGRKLEGLRTSQIAALGLVRTFQKTSVFGGRSALDNVLIGLHLRARQTPLAILLALPYVAREEQELRGESSTSGVKRKRSCGSLVWRKESRSWRRRFPMATRGSSRSRSRWRRSRSS